MWSDACVSTACECVSMCECTKACCVYSMCECLSVHAQVSDMPQTQ